jgi:O-antigen/teichoic acid export membrane protein
MGVVIRQSIKGSVSAYFGVLIGLVSYLVVFPMAMSAEQIGLYRVLVDASLFLMPFIHAGVVSVAMRYYPYFTHDHERYRRFKGYVFYLPLIIFSVFCGLSVVFEDFILGMFIEKSELLARYYYYIIPLSIIFVYNSIMEAHLRNKLRIVVPKIIRENVVRVLTMCAVGLYFIQAIDFDMVINLVVLIYVLQFILLNVYAFFLDKGLTIPSPKFYKDPLFSEMLKYSGYMIAGSSGGVIVSKIDTLMTYQLIDLNSTGIYSIAFFMAVVIELPRRTIQSIISPIVSKALKNKDMLAVQLNYRKSSLNQIIIGSILFILVWTNIDNIFQLIPNGDIYSAGKYVVLFIALAKLFEMAMGIHNVIISNSKYYRWNIFFMPFLGVLTIVTNLILIPIYGIIGTAIATAISIIITNILRLALVYVKFNIQPFSRDTVKAIVISIVVFLIAYFIPSHDNPIVDLIIRSTAAATSFSFLIMYFGVSSDINDLYARVKKRYFS